MVAAIFAICGVAPAQQNILEYVTILRAPKEAEATAHIIHERYREGRELFTHIRSRGQDVLLKEGEDGSITLYLPGAGEAFRAPKPGAGEPIPSVSYLAKVYANFGAPKEKKGGLLAKAENLIGGDLSAAVPNLASLAGGDFLASVSSLGNLGELQALKGATTQRFMDLAGERYQQKLGRAVSTILMSTELEDKILLTESVRVDGKLMADTLLLRIRESAEAESKKRFRIPDGVAPTDVSPQELFERFTTTLVGSEE